MLICMPLPPHGSSTVLSSPLLLFRKHNIILSPATSPIDASASADEIGGRRCLWCGGEGTRLTTRTQCSRCATVGERGKGSGGRRWFDDGGAHALNGGRHGGLEDSRVTSDPTKSDFTTRSNARCNIRSYLCNNEKYMIKITSSDPMRF